MEKFYLGEARAGEVMTAGDSIVMYERWRRLGDEQLLADIAEYNRIDCISTLRCRDWLAGMRPDGAPWFAWAPEAEARGSAEERTEAEERKAAMADEVLAGEPAKEDRRQLTVDLHAVHRRDAHTGRVG